MTKAKPNIISKFEKNIQIITGFITLIYLVVVITDIGAVSNNGKLSLIDIISISFFILFLFGTICCLDYPLITGSSFLSWFLLRLLVIYKGQELNLYTGEHTSFVVLSGFMFIPVFFLGFIFIFFWIDRRNLI